MAQSDIEALVVKPDGDTAWGANMRGAMSTIGAVTSTGAAQRSASLMLDPSGGFITRNAVLTLARDVNAPTGIAVTSFSVTEGNGDNTTFRGVSGSYTQARDRTDVTAANKGVLYAGQFSVVPRVSRNKVPFDDVACLVLQNDTGNASKGTDALYIGTAGSFAAGAPEWISGVLVDCSADYAFRATKTYSVGIDFVAGGPAAITSAHAIRVPNNKSLTGRNAGNTADVEMIRVSSNNAVELSPGGSICFVSADLALGPNRFLIMSEGANVSAGTTTGTRIGTAATQKLGFWNATPVVQPSNIVNADGTLADLTTKFNALLAQRRTTGEMAAA